MLITRLDHVPAPDDDAHLIQVLQSLCLSSPADISQRRIALLGDDGRTYRMIVAHGVREYAGLLDALSTLRFDPSRALVGVDAVLQRRPDKSGYPNAARW